MEGHAKSVFSLFVENKCFIVPIYQRPYSWKIEQCRQMFNDILACASGKRDSHFFGSVVRVADGDGSLVIDGQQRLTTISLLLLAIKNEVLARNNSGIKWDARFRRAAFRCRCVHVWRKGLVPLGVLPQPASPAAPSRRGLIDSHTSPLREGGGPERAGGSTPRRTCQVHFA